jgi:hypothetical protein
MRAVEQHVPDALHTARDIRMRNTLPDRLFIRAQQPGGYRRARGVLA